jgi:hypothetical protein
VAAQIELAEQGRGLHLYPPPGVRPPRPRTPLLSAPILPGAAAAATRTTGSPRHASLHHPPVAATSMASAWTEHSASTTASRSSSPSRTPSWAIVATSRMGSRRTLRRWMVKNRTRHRGVGSTENHHSLRQWTATTRSCCRETKNHHSLRQLTAITRSRRGRRGCRGSLTAGNQFLRLRVGPQTVAQMGGTQDLYWFGSPESNTLRPVCDVVLFALICSRGYK